MKVESTFDVNILSTVGSVAGRVTCFVRQRPMTNRKRPIVVETAHPP